MRFILISRHTGGSEIPDNEKDQNLRDMGQWLATLNAQIAIPIRGGKSVTANNVDTYDGDIGGVIIFEAENLDQAVALAKRSPGLKYGFTHEVFPEISLEDAAAKKTPTQDFTLNLVAKASAKEAMSKINQVNAWWAKNFKGQAANLGDEFSVYFGDTFVDFKVSEFVPNKRVVWLVTDCNLNWVRDKKE